jgi:hypothetical protein
MAKRNTLEHPKTSHLARLIGWDPCGALGVLEALWHFAGRFAVSGDVGKFPDDEIAKRVMWSRPPEQLIAALVVSGWLDVPTRDRKARLVIHDHALHADDTTKTAMKRKGESFWTGSVFHGDEALLKLGEPYASALLALMDSSRHDPDRVAIRPRHDGDFVAIVSRLVLDYATIRPRHDDDSTAIPSRFDRDSVAIPSRSSRDSVAVESPLPETGDQRPETREKANMEVSSNWEPGAGSGRTPPDAQKRVEIPDDSLGLGSNHRKNGAGTVPIDDAVKRFEEAKRRKNSDPEPVEIEGFTSISAMRARRLGGEG